MVKLAMDRNPSAKSLAKNHNRIRGYGKTKEHPETEDLSKAAAVRLEQMPHDRVTITGRDGLKLVGHWFPQQNAARIVLAMHGWRSSWTADFGAIAPFFQQNGCSLYRERVMP